MLKINSPERIKWEEEILTLLEDEGMDRSDAQGVFMTKSEDLDEAYESKAGAEETYAKLFPQDLTFKPDRKYDQYGAEIQLCTMYFKGVEFGYERSYLPKHWARKPCYSCHPNNVFYDELEVKEIAAKFGASAVGDPYNEKAWYLEFEGEERYANMVRFYLEYAKDLKDTKVPDDEG